jgi:hypothetical protein
MKKNILSALTLATQAMVCFCFLLYNVYARQLPDTDSFVANTCFVENKGQFDSQVKYRAEVPGGLLFLTSDEMVYLFSEDKHSHGHHTSEQKPKHKHHKHGKASGKQSDSFSDAKDIVRHHAYKVRIQNARKQAVVPAEKPTGTRYNFLLGKDRSKWVRNANAYEAVVYEQIYEGIDLRVLSVGGSVKYEFEVSRGASPEQISLLFEGYDKLSLSKGNLVVTTSLGTVTEQKPYSYQIIKGDTVVVPTKFVLEGNRLSYKFPKGYNRRHTLVIYPFVAFSTFFNKSSNVLRSFFITFYVL